MPNTENRKNSNKKPTLQEHSQTVIIPQLTPEMLEQARRADGAAKVSTCLSAEQYLADKAVFLPVTYSSQYFASAPGVSGFIFHPYGGGVDFTNARK